MRRDLLILLYFHAQHESSMPHLLNSRNTKGEHCCSLLLVQFQVECLR